MSFRRTKLYDLLAATPLLAVYGLGSWGLWTQSGAALRAALMSRNALEALDAAVFAVSLLFVVFQAVLFLARRTPVLFSEGWLPAAIAVSAANVSLAFLLLPRNAMQPMVHVLSGTLVLGGTAGSLWALRHLGCAFSILPQARILATGGPYRFIRHPLYLFETIGLLGVTLEFDLRWSPAIFAASLMLQLWRIRFEEHVLARAFPEYRVYAARTPRLIPSLH